MIILFTINIFIISSCSMTSNFSRLREHIIIEEIHRGIIVSKDSTKNGILFFWQKNEIQTAILFGNKVSLMNTRHFKKVLKEQDSMSYLDFNGIFLARKELDSSHYIVSSDYNNQPRLYCFSITNGKFDFLYDSFRVELSPNEEKFYAFAGKLLAGSVSNNCFEKR